MARLTTTKKNVIKYSKLKWNKGPFHCQVLNIYSVLFMVHTSVNMKKFVFYKFYICFLQQH